MQAVSLRPGFLIEVGSVIQFEYPDHNFKELPKQPERRRLLVQDIRDTEERPIQPGTVAADPLRDRGRFLIEGTCLEKLETRHFYLERMSQVEVIEVDDLQTLRLGLYDPCDPEAATQAVGRVFLDTPADREEMRRLIDDYNRISRQSHLCMGIFSWGLH